jgi:Transposase DDE domain
MRRGVATCWLSGGRRRRASAEGEEEALLSLLDAAVSKAFAALCRPVQKNLAVLTVAFLRVLGAVRSGHGRLTLAALFRVLPTAGTPHAREKRLHRFLRNPRLDPRGITNGLAQLICGSRGRGLWPILFDQTKAGATQALLAGVPFRGRTLPLAVYTFQYPWQEKTARSQNQLEEVFLADIETALPSKVRPVFIGDRGYARAALLRRSNRQARVYILRGRAGTRVEYKGRSYKLGELQGRYRRAVRYPGVLYQAKERVPVDVVVYHDPEYQEPWWLLVPPGSQALLPAKAVVALYRERMQVEQSFRDFKTHLGLRGLQLQVDIAPRTGRLLLAFTMAYCLALVLGVSREAEQARQDLEIPRRKPRHGSRRTLSVLYVALLMLSHPRWRQQAYVRLRWLVAWVAAGRALLLRAPPPLTDRRLAAA